MRFTTLAVLAVFAVFARAPVADAEPLAGGVKPATVGYPSVAAALTGLRAKPGIVESVHNGWTVIHDPARKTVWSFTPKGHPVSPAVVKRQIVGEGQRTKIKINAICETTPQDCQKLMDDFAVADRAMWHRVRTYSAAPEFRVKPNASR